MPCEEKSIDIKLYSLSKVKAAFGEIAATDDMPAADVIAAMRDQILDCLGNGRSIAWVISVLQRAGIDLGARQIRTYLQRAGIGRDAKRTARGSSGMRTARKTKTASEAPEHEACGQACSAERGSDAVVARAENVRNACGERERACAPGAKPACAGSGSSPAECVHVPPATDVQTPPAADVQYSSSADVQKKAWPEHDKMAAYNALKTMRGE